jgi:pimeloyl-[acyl-carrier protein] methyl ester esterase
MATKKIKCVFVHGWGMNRAIWQPVLDTLPDWVEQVAVDLPGHGSMADGSFETLDDLVQALDQSVKEPAVWIAWSLGGLAVMQLALQKPQKVQAMMLVSSSPCFVQKQDWPTGMKADVFDDFANELEKDFSGTIRRFLSLQVRGSDSGRVILRSLRKEVLAQPAANIEALRSGLNLLKNVDLRCKLAQLDMPVCWSLGERDGLVKSSLASELKKLMPDAEVNVFNQAAHAPFLSHLPEFNKQLIKFVKTHTTC